MELIVVKKGVDGTYRYTIIHVRIKQREVAMYEFEAIHEFLPEEERITLSRLFAHELMGEIALEWTELIRYAIEQGHEIALIKIHKDDYFIGVAIVSIVRRLDWTKYLWQPVAPFFKLFGSFDVGFLEVPFSNFPGLLTVEGIDHAERGAIIDELCVYIRGTLHLDILCIKIDNTVELSDNSHCHKKLTSLTFYPNTILNYPYKSLDEFFNSLTRKKFRKCRADRRALEKYKGNVEVCHDISTVVPRVYELYKKTSGVVKKKPHFIEMPVSIDKEFFSGLPLFNRLKPVFVLVKVNDAIIAYSLLMQSGNTLFFKAVGLDYDMSFKTKAYFNLYYATMEYASQQKCDKIDFGVTSYHFKKWIGCKLYPTQYFCDASHPLLSLVRKQIAYFIERSIGTLGSGPD